MLDVGIQKLDNLAWCTKGREFRGQGFSLGDQDVAEEDVAAGRVQQAH